MRPPERTRLVASLTSLHRIDHCSRLGNAHGPERSTSDAILVPLSAGPWPDRLLHAARVQGGARELRGHDALCGAGRARSHLLEARDSLAHPSIAVLSPVRWTSFRRNEVRDLASPRVPHLITNEPDQRSQRNTLALRDVDYLIACSFELTSRAGNHDNAAKFSKMFQHRLERGQHFEPPFLRIQEFTADVEPASPEAVEPIDRGVTRRLGQMFFDFEPVEIGQGRQLFFEARLESGVLHVPPLRTVMRDNGLDARRAP